METFKKEQYKELTIEADVYTEMIQRLVQTRNLVRSLLEDNSTHVVYEDLHAIEQTLLKAGVRDDIENELEQAAQETAEHLEQT